MSFERIMRTAKHPSEGGAPQPGYRLEHIDGMLIERDVAIELRDGAIVYADVFRPEGGGDLGALIAWSPYGKHNSEGNLDSFFERGGVRREWLSGHEKFEGPDPAYWCKRGYAVINPETRGTWYSSGDATFWGPEEGQDYYDVIEWVARQDWSNGRVGLSGVSYLAISQWFAAAERPPHLAAINPWEGFSDLYREFCFHGGIPDTGMPVGWNTGDVNYSLNRIEDIVAMMETHPLWDEYWESKAAALSKIDVPAYVVASWSDQGLHTRGTLEGFKKISSPDKWLEVHGRRKWEYFYQPSSVERQRQFFDHFLLGKETPVRSWPRVVLEVRESSYVGSMRPERDWPVPDTQYQRLYLDLDNGTLEHQKPQKDAVRIYESEDSGIAFHHVFSEDTELTGHMSLRLWVEALDSNDMDLFIAVEKYDAEGEFVGFPFYSCWLDGPVALGWLRASHRALDQSQSTEFQPVYKHTQEDILQPGEIVAVDIEILPSSTLFRAGEQLRLVIAGKDIHNRMSSHLNTRNAGRHAVHTGQDRLSFLTIPVLPRTQSRMA